MGMRFSSVYSNEHTISDVHDSGTGILDHHSRDYSNSIEVEFKLERTTMVKLMELLERIETIVLP